MRMGNSFSGRRTGRRKKHGELKRLIANGELDHALQPVVRKLIEGPFMTESACSGHLLRSADGHRSSSMDTDDTSKVPYLEIREDMTTKKKAKRVQEEFRRGGGALYG